MKKNYSILILALFLLILSSKTLAATTDLMMENITINPTNPKVGEQTTITFWGKNNGNLTLYGGNGINNVGVSIPDFQGGNLWYMVGAVPDPSTNPLRPGEIYSYSYVGSFTSDGNKVISLKTDNANELAESNEYNNSISGTIFVGTPTGLDLKIDNVQISPTKPIVGQPVTITITGSYVGGAAINNSDAIGSIGFFHNDFQTSAVGSLSPKPSIINPLVSGSRFFYTISGSFTNSGNKNLVFKIDDKNYLNEINENNNTFNQAVEVLEGGSLIKVANRSEIFIVKADGKKHSFVNAATFWSHYTGDWNRLYQNGNVVYINTISQADFDAIKYGNNITIKPGSKLIKFLNNSQIFTVYDGNKLKLIEDSSALTWYGSGYDWRNKVVTIQDIFTIDYIFNSMNFIDIDDDGVSNIDELNLYKTDPYKWDSDGDGYSDGWEILNGYNPNGPGKL